MSTSLAEQLKRLQKPQTSRLLDQRQKPSILFDPKEAANKDRETIYEIGLSGLEELVALNGEFRAFEATLFDRTARDLERSVEDTEVNRHLDKNLKRFLIRLSPYFMLQSSHKCLEWLIRRFHVESYNQDEVMMAILPFYESRIFIRCVQALDLRAAEQRWGWLRGVAKSGLALSKQTLMNHAGSDSFFLHFIGKMVTDSVKEHGNRSHTLQALIGFYTTTVIGALESVREVGESHVISLLPSLLKGFSSSAVDFTAASYMVLGQLISKTSITPTTLERIIGRIVVTAPVGLQMDATMLLILIYQTQKHFGHISDEALRSVVVATWIPKYLGQLVAQGVRIDRFVLPVLASALRKVQQKSENLASCKSFCENLLLDVRFSDEDAELVIRCALNNYVLREKRPDVITIDSGDESDIALSDSNMDVSSWYSSFLKSLERQYPETFDRVIKHIMSSKEEISEGRKTSLKAVLGFLLKVSFTDGEENIFENLYHHQAKFRVEAVKYLVKNFSKIAISGESEDLLRDSLGERLTDDNPKVIEQALKLSTTALIHLLGEEVLVEKLIATLNRSAALLANWNKAKLLCIRHLTDYKEWKYGDYHRIFLTIFQYLFPKNNESVELTKQILKSNYGKSSVFLQKCGKKIQESKSDTAEDFRYGVYETLLDKSGLPEAKHLITHIQTEAGSLQKFYALLLISSALKSDTDRETSEKFLEFLAKSLQTAEIVSKDLKKSHEIVHNNKLPLSLISQCFESIIGCEDFPQVVVFELLLKRFFSSLGQEESRRVYEGLLKQFLERISPSLEGKFDFLADFFVNHPPELQVQAIKLTNAILESSEPEEVSDSVVRKFLIGLGSENSVVRKCVIETWEILENSSSDRLKLFSRLLMEQKEELEMDSEQISLVLYNILAPNRGVKRKFSEKKHLESIRKALMDFAADVECSQRQQQGHILVLCQYINDAEMLEKLAPVATEIMKRNKEFISAEESLIVKQIVMRFNQDTMKSVSRSPKTWEFVQEVMKCGTVLDKRGQALTSTAVEFVENFDEEMFSVLNEEFQEQFLRLLVEVATFSDWPDVATCLGRFIRKIDLEAKILGGILNEMQNAKAPSASQKKPLQIIPSVDVLKTRQWLMGVTLLEFIQSKKKVRNMKILLEVLFSILKRCVEFEEQSPVEYTKQIVLSSILLSCQDSTAISRDKFDTVFKIDLVIQCIRASHNPQTHHHALQLICFVSSIIPEQVLHNMMDIFTFMGSSVVRQDDAYSFQIISSIIENVIPILVKQNDEKSESLVAPVINVFVDIVLDVPEHRRLPMYVKLIETLNAGENLWLFLAILFGSHVLRSTKTKKDPKQDAGELPKRIQVALALANEFPPDTVLTTCTRLLEHVQKMLGERKEAEREASSEIRLVNLEGATEKQIRHFRYITTQFVSNLTSSAQFVTHVATMNAEDFMRMKPFYQNIIIRELMFIGEASKCLERNSDQHKYWKIVLQHCYDTLDNSILLLSPDMFLVVINGLLQHKILMVRRKVIELLVNKLQQKDEFFKDCDDTLFLQVLTQLRVIIDTITSKEEASAHEMAMLQQAALIAVKILSKILAENQTDVFKSLLNQLIGILKKHKSLQPILLAAVILSIAEISANLRVHALSGLSVFMPIFLQILTIEIQDNESVDMHTVSVITALQKVIDTLPLFLSPYLERMLTLVSKLRVKVQKITPQDSKTTSILSKIDSISHKISTFIPLRILVPAVENSYSQLIEDNATDAVAPLMSILSESFVDVPSKDILAIQEELSEFFLKALKFRSANPDLEDVSVIEEKIIRALVALILKLSEGSFKTLYYNIYDWAIREEKNRDRVITFYSLSHHIAKTLKSLFVVLAVDFVQNAADLLNSCNLAKVAPGALYYVDNEEKSQTLIEHILQTILQICLYDSRQFMTSHRCEILLQPMIDQLDNPLLRREEVRALLSSALAGLGAAGADNLWQQLNYGVLMKTRHADPDVRLLALGTCVEFARKIGQDFQSLLPETIPFLSELLEDESAAVERGCKAKIHDLEEILNDSLQKYF